MPSSPSPRSPSPTASTSSTQPTSTSASHSPSPPTHRYIDPFSADSDSDSNPEITTAHEREQEQEQEPSDLPLLRRTHLTTGYRAGLSAGKENPETAQRGFDAGYGIGATLGARVGWVLGALGALRGFAAASAGARTEGEGEMLGRKIKEVEGECSVERLAEVVEGVRGPQTVEERESGVGVGEGEKGGMEAALSIVGRWVLVVEGLCQDVGVEMKFPGMLGEKGVLNQEA